MSFSRHMLCIASVLSATTLLLLSPRPAAAELIGVASSGIAPGAIYSVSEATGTATLLTTTPGTRPSFVGAEFRQGVLYVSDVESGGDFVLGTYDLATGAFTQVSDQGNFLDIWGLAYRPSNDLFYGIEGSAGGQPLVTISPLNGAVTTIGSTNTTILGLAFNQASDILYGISLDGTTLNLVTINTASGAVTTIGATGQTSSSINVGLAFDEDNDILYMNTASGTSTPDSLFTVDITTGTATLVGSNGAVLGRGIDGLAWRSSIAAAAPEPGSLALLALTGLPLVGSVIRRRRTA